VKSESVTYAAGDIRCRGELIYDDGARGLPLLLMAPNWRGVSAESIETGRMLAGHGYVVLVADMFGAERGPKGNENPMAFLAPFLADVAGTRTRIVAGMQALTDEADRRGIGDVSRRAAIGYCYGGSNVLDLARTGADVAAVVSVHGVLATSQPAGKGDIKAAVLVLHGAADPIAPKADRDALETEMDTAGGRWMMLTFGGVPHGYTDPNANRPPSSKYSEPATRHGYALAHGFIADAFIGEL
jgi:dienelactone hydrolase